MSIHSRVNEIKQLQKCFHKLTRLTIAKKTKNKYSKYDEYRNEERIPDALPMRFVSRKPAVIAKHKSINVQLISGI